VEKLVVKLQKKNANGSAALEDADKAGAESGGIKEPSHST
jgi:hypothetical protein